MDSEFAIIGEYDVRWYGVAEGKQWKSLPNTGILTDASVAAAGIPIIPILLPLAALCTHTQPIADRKRRAWCPSLSLLPAISRHVCFHLPSVCLMSPADSRQQQAGKGAKTRTDA
jgi:hypothetical protein